MIYEAKLRPAGGQGMLRIWYTMCITIRGQEEHEGSGSDTYMDIQVVTSEVTQVLVCNINYRSY